MGATEYASICRALCTLQTGGFLQGSGVYWYDSVVGKQKIYRAHEKRLVTDSRLLLSVTIKHLHAVHAAEPSSRPYKIPRYSSCNLSVGLWGMPGDSDFDVEVPDFGVTGGNRNPCSPSSPRCATRSYPVTPCHTSRHLLWIDSLAAAVPKSYPFGVPLGVPSRPR